MSGNKLSWLALCLLAAISVGCSDSGGGTSTNDDDEPVTLTQLKGTFVDSPVEGMSYQTDSFSGQTNAQGEYTYYEGEYVKFSLGNVLLPPVYATATITPYSLARTADPDNDLAINIARFLQSLDSDGDPGNGIAISDEVRGKLEGQNEVIQFNSDEFESQFNDLINAANIATTLVSADDAKDHLTQTMAGYSPMMFTQPWLEGRTLYLVYYGEGDLGDSEPQDVPVMAQMTFYADYIEYQGLVNDINVGTVDYSVVDGKIRFEDGDSSDFSEMACGVHQDYIATHNTSGDTINGVELFFFERSKAEEYIRTLDSELEPCDTAPKTIIPTVSGYPDWSQIDLMMTDPAGDAGISGYDITGVKLAQNENYLYARLEKAGSEIIQGKYYGNYWIHFSSDPSYSFAVSMFHYDGNVEPKLWDITGHPDYTDYRQLYQDIPVYEDGSSIVAQIPKSQIDMDLVYEVDFFTHYSNLPDTWNGEDVSENDRGRFYNVGF